MGSNIFTPILVTRGWKFWQRPVLSPDEAEAVNKAQREWNDQIGRLLEAVQSIQNNSPNTRETLEQLAKGLWIVDDSFIEVSGKLKRLLDFE